MSEALRRSGWARLAEHYEREEAAEERAERLAWARAERSRREHVLEAAEAAAAEAEAGGF